MILIDKNHKYLYSIVPVGNSDSGRKEIFMYIGQIRTKFIALLRGGRLPSRKEESETWLTGCYS